MTELNITKEIIFSSFLLKLVNGNIDDLILISQLSYLVPRSNSKHYFHFYSNRENISCTNPLSNMMSLVNSLFAELNIDLS